MIVRFSAVCGLALWASCGLAADACRDPQTQAEMTYCAGEDYTLADRELNAVYARVRAAVPEAERERLRAAQLAWIKLRDLDCDLAAFGVRGGSIESMTIAGCKTQHTNQRIEWLRSLLAESL